MSGSSGNRHCASAPPSETGRAENALQGLCEISKILSVPGRLEAVLSDVLNALARFVPMRRGMIALIDEAGRATAAIGAGWDESDAKAQFHSLPKSFVGRLVAARQPFAVEEVKGVVLVGAPIVERDHVIGVLIVDRLRDQGSGEEDARFLAMIGAMIGQTLHLYDIFARDRERLMEERRQLEKEPPRQKNPQHGEQALIGIVGVSPAIRAVFNQINVVARTHTSVLLRGESGTGKELFARAAHDLSPRKNGPFVRVNCAALSENLLESELFGHEKGSFTGAAGQRKGRFELADTGTLFLDEIGDISPAFQAKLLRVLQEGEFERVGGSRTVKVDVRFVFATNRNLEAAVESGGFRADLYYRINVVSILLPPLRERPDDVAPLAQEFLRRFNEENGAKKKLTAGALRRLQGCWFPGNVRELENCVRRAAALSQDDSIGEEDFACARDSCLSSTLWRDFKSDAPVYSRAPLAAPMRRSAVEGAGGASDREKLIGAMEKAGWVQAKAARLLNLTPRQIAYALDKHHIEIKKF